MSGLALTVALLAVLLVVVAVLALAGPHSADPDDAR